MLRAPLPAPGVGLFLAAVENEAHRGASLARQLHRRERVGPQRQFRTEAAARGFHDDPHSAERQAEGARQVSRAPAVNWVEM